MDPGNRGVEFARPLDWEKAKTENETMGQKKIYDCKCPHKDMD